MMHKFTIRNIIMLNYYFYAYMYLLVLRVHLRVAVAGIDISDKEHYSIFWNYLQVCVFVTRLARGSRWLDAITCTRKVGVLPHIKHYTKPKSRSKAFMADLGGEVC